MKNLDSQSYPNLKIPWSTHLAASKGQAWKTKQKEIFQVLSIKDFQNFVELSLEFMINFFLRTFIRYVNIQIFKKK
mgnify:CR=1 FL=1